MSHYLFYKWLHIVASVVLVGVGFGNAFHLQGAFKTRTVGTIVAALRQAVLADWLLTVPALLLMPATGVLMVKAVGFTWGSEWIRTSSLLTLLTVLCWLPVPWLQYRLRELAQAAQARHDELSARFWRLAAWRQWLGLPILLALLFMYWLMVAKPI